MMKRMKDLGVQDLTAADHDVAQSILNLINTWCGAPVDSEVESKVALNIQHYRTVLHQQRLKEQEHTTQDLYSPTTNSAYPDAPKPPQPQQVEVTKPYTPSQPSCGKCLYVCCQECHNAKSICKCHVSEVSVSGDEYSSGSDEESEDKMQTSDSSDTTVPPAKLQVFLDNQRAALVPQTLDSTPVVPVNL